MSALPRLRFPEFEEEWEETTLSEQAISLDRKRKPVRSTDRCQGPYPYYGASGVIDYIDDYIFDEETVLLAEDGANILNRSTPISFIATGKYWVNNHAHVYKAKYSSVFLSTALERIDYTNYNTGTTMPKLNAQTCASLPLVFPKPEEQQKIASFLSSVDKKIGLMRQKKDALELYKKGLMQKIFSQEIRFKQDDGSDFPDWEDACLGQILREVSIKSYENNQHEILSSTISGVVSQSSYFKGQVASQDNVGYKVLRKGQLVISPQNIWLGNINISRFEVGIVSPSYKIFSLNLCMVDEAYIEAILKTPRMLHEYLCSSEQGASVVRRNLNMDLFLSITVSLPSVKEQQKIASFLSAIDSKIQNTSAQIEQMETFKKGLLQQMFV